MRKNNQKGSSLLITLLITAAFLSVAIGLSILSMGEIKITPNVSKSLIAFYAAESGIECQMFNDRQIDPSTICGNGGYVYLNAGNGISYKITTAEGVSPNRIIHASGYYKKDVTRAIELTY